MQALVCFLPHVNVSNEHQTRWKQLRAGGLVQRVELSLTSKMESERHRFEITGSFLEPQDLENVTNKLG